MNESLVFRVDGGSRGNPGPAGFGVVVSDPSQAVIDRLSEFVGIGTNNFAEYSGLIAALRYAREHGAHHVLVYSDSELMVRQMQGRYAVRSAGLRPLFEEASRLAAQLQSFRIEHVYREQNSEADRLANCAMDSAGAARRPPSSR